MTAMLPTDRCHITYFPVKNPPLRCGLSSDLLDLLLALWFLWFILRVIGRMSVAVTALFDFDIVEMRHGVSCLEERKRRSSSVIS